MANANGQILYLARLDLPHSSLNCALTVGHNAAERFLAAVRGEWDELSAGIYDAFIWMVIHQYSL